MTAPVIWATPIGRYRRHPWPISRAHFITLIHQLALSIDLASTVRTAQWGHYIIRHWIFTSLTLPFEFLTIGSVRSEISNRIYTGPLLHQAAVSLDTVVF